MSYKFNIYYLQYLRTKSNTQKIGFAASGGLNPYAGLTADLENYIKKFPEVGIVTDDVRAATQDLNDTMSQLSLGMSIGIKFAKDYHTATEQLVDSFTYLEQVNSSLNKSFGLNSKAAAAIAGKFRDIAIQVGYGDEKIFGFAAGLKDLTGGMIASSNKIDEDMRSNMLSFQAFAQGNLGIAEDAAQGYEMYARDIGVSGADAAIALKALTDTFEAGTGLSSLQLQKTIMEEIGGLSEDLRISYSRIPGSLEVAVLKAKALGFTMQQLNDAGSELMNIENSVGKEIEYQLLTGRRLTVEGEKSLTNEYRMAKLRGDANRQAELMSKFIKQEGETLRNNYMAREQAAQLFGMDVNVISKALEKEQIATKLGVDNILELQGNDFNKKIAELKQQYKGNKEKLAEIDTLMETADTRTSHERVVEDNLSDIAAGIKRMTGGGAPSVKQPKRFDNRVVEKGATDLDVDKVAKQMDKYRTKYGRKYADTFMDNQSTAISTGKLFKKQRVADAVVSPVNKNLGPLTAISGLNNVVQQITSIMNNLYPGDMSKKVNDALIMPNKGPIIKPAPNDVIAAFRPNDVVHKTLNGLNTNTPSSINIESVLAKLADSMQSSKSNTPVTVNMDISALAKEFAAAMKNVKLETTVRNDSFLSATRMNSEKKFT